MLKFIFGLPCSGKTYTCLQKIKELTEQGEETVLMVPEQFSFDCEREVLRLLGDSFALKTTVLTFSRLVDEVARKIGGISARVLNESDKVIFMNKALIISANDLKLWGKYVHSVKFSKTLLQIISEFKINAVKPNDLKSAAANTEKLSLKNKLLDLAVVYENYDLLTNERFIDPTDNLSRLYDNLLKYRYFENKTVFLDSFKGFTGAQFKILERIISQAKDVYISLTNDTENISEFDIFTNLRTTASKLQKIAKKYNVTVEEPLILKNPRYSSGSLNDLERLMAGRPTENFERDGAVTVCKANTVFDEAEFTARTIRRLVRTKNYRFRDFVIIARDTQKYADAIEYSCQKNNVPYFSDRRVPLSSMPIAVLCDYAIKALNFSTENIFGFLKSGISLLTTEEISLLENYTYLWNINGDIWLKEWDMNVRGFVAGEPNESDTLELKKINALREKAIKPIVEFKTNFKGNAFNMCKAIVNLFDQCKLTDALKGILAKFGEETDLFTNDALKQSFDVFNGILDSLVVCFGERTLSKDEFYEALSLAVSYETIGVIPQNLDQVTFGEADRIRPSRPKIAFILGANQGVFPKYSDNSGVFLISERKELIELGLCISDNSVYTAIEENYLVYCNVCCATDMLFICYSLSSLKGEVLEPSAFVLSITDNLNPVITAEPKPLTIGDNLPETEKSLFSEFCRRAGDLNEAATIKSAFCDSESVDNLVKTLSANSHKSITKENAQKLFGKDIYMSATKLDTFNRCKFSFFCKYGIKPQKIEPADFSVLQRGTIVHYVLERIISDYKETIKDLSKAELDSLTDGYINEYLELVSGFSSIKTAKHSFIISKISRSLKEVVTHLAEEFAQSDFKPVSCELEIGNNGIQLEFPYNNGKLVINGSIDRVDEYNGYIRVIDYKTGSKKFKLPDVLFGLNIQMLLYLYAVTKTQNNMAAGILYMPSKRDLNDEGMAMNGLILADMDIVTAMEKQNKGEFVPVLSTNKDGSVSKRLTSFATKEEFETIFAYIEKIMKDVGNEISNGKIEVAPVDGRESNACDYCDYKSVCGIESKIGFKVPNLKNSEVFEKMKEAEDSGI